MNMVDQITAGDTLDFTTVTADYPASDGWVLVYKLIPRTAGTVYTLTSTADGDDHRIQATAATTAAWTAGTYSWAAYATLGTESYTLETGVTQVLPNPRTATTLDTRTSAAVALDNVVATLQGRATSAVLEYEIAGRRLKYLSPADLIKLKSHLEREVASEQAAARLAAGLTGARKIQFRV